MKGCHVLKFLIIYIFSATLFASTTPEDSIKQDKISYQKSCDANWQKLQNGHHRHIGRAVCSCLGDTLAQYKAVHRNDADFDVELNHFIEQASQFCTTAGIFDNTVQLANFDRMQNTPEIQDICNSFWVGIMKSFVPADPKFDSKKYVPVEVRI